MRDEPAFAALERIGLECILLAETPGYLLDLGTFPGLLAAETETGLVRGEFLRLRDFGGALDHLDRYEGFRGFDRADSLFVHRLVSVDVGRRR